ncbi:major facilitator superfamily MFS 1, putative [Babesia ovata]|uniref:Major facilitator superfamily MFS 1, putative n=1 Tax=Babesia ovata TaxID=189622 RepID=A0A2H6KE84_9APIC|nr:major facilitator superfamily MFS 1, putative [Babesia ovata]GBE61310.1 major facilitator superfamily MFS 1, putative [Babesia ovata]
MRKGGLSKCVSVGGDKDLEKSRMLRENLAISYSLYHCVLLIFTDSRTLLGIILFVNGYSDDVITVIIADIIDGIFGGVVGGVMVLIIDSVIRRLFPSLRSDRVTEGGDDNPEACDGRRSAPNSRHDRKDK